MKHFYIVFFAALTGFFLAACGEEKKAAPEQQEGIKEKTADVSPRQQEEAEPVVRKLPGLENGVIKITSPADDGKAPGEPRIQDDSLHIRYLPLKGEHPALPGNESVNKKKRKWDIVSTRSGRSMAAALMKYRKKYIVWAPKLDQDRRVNLPDVQMSRDQSLLVFVENFGKPGVQGSRIVIFDTASWEIISIFKTKRRVIKIALPGNIDTPAAVLCAGQPNLDQVRGIAFLDWRKNGEEVNFLPAREGINTSMYPGRCFLYDNDNQICIAGHGKLFQPPKEDFVKIHTDAMAFSPDGTSFAAAGSGHVDVYSMPSFQKMKSYSYPGSGKVRQILFLDNSGMNFILAPEPDANMNFKEAFILKNGKQTVIPGWSAGYNAISGDGSAIYAVKQANGEVEIIDAATMQKIRIFAPASVQPKAKSSAIRAVYPMDRSGLIAVLDESGMFSLLFMPEKSKKYEKEILFAPVP